MPKATILSCIKTHWLVYRSLLAKFLLPKATTRRKYTPYSILICGALVLVWLTWPRRMLTNLKWGAPTHFVSNQGDKGPSTWHTTRSLTKMDALLPHVKMLMAFKWSKSRIQARAQLVEFILQETTVFHASAKCVTTTPTSSSSASAPL